MMAMHIRPSAIAGHWYPGNEDELSSLIDRMLDSAELEHVREERPFGLIVPHAGYTYSGSTAAHAYRLIKRQSIQKVVILSPMHRWGPGRYFSPFATHYETPLGPIAIDVDGLQSLSKEIALSFVKNDAEHAIEIQLPFLQRVLTGFHVLPIMIGAISVYDVDELVHALVQLEGYENALWIASSDLHHESDYKLVVERDHAIVNALRSGTLDEIKEVLDQPGCTACGRVPMTALIQLSHYFGHPSVQILHQTNSGEITGQTQPGQYTVGYLAAATY
jgi:AmmeMemoRadiSam system protein B